jgi:hypothetical protein
MILQSVNELVEEKQPIYLGIDVNKDEHDQIGKVILRRSEIGHINDGPMNNSDWLGT